MKNEALRLFLAITALIITALLTNPAPHLTTEEPVKMAAVKTPTKGVATQKSDRKPSKASRSFAFFFRR